jgi:hypothetical protein
MKYLENKMAKKSNEMHYDNIKSEANFSCSQNQLLPFLEPSLSISGPFWELLTTEISYLHIR